MQVVQPNPSIHIPNVVQIGLLSPSPMQVDISAKSPNRETAFNYASTPLAVKAPSVATPALLTVKGPPVSNPHFSGGFLYG